LKRILTTLTNSLSAPQLSANQAPGHERREVYSEYGTHLVAVSGMVLCPSENLGIRVILRQTSVMVICQRCTHQQKGQNYHGFLFHCVSFS
jgi:hypothetical protein